MAEPKTQTVTLPSGATITGTTEQLRTMLPLLGHANLLGDETYYFSESRGPVRIAEMETTHLRNAILKYYASWVNDMHAITNPTELCTKMMNGIDSPCWLAMVREYSRRTV